MIEHFQDNFSVFLEMDPFAQVVVGVAGLLIGLVIWRIKLHL